MAAVILLASLGTMTPVRADGGCPTYTVLPGDTLISISMKFKVSLPDLLEANPSIKNVNNIWVGQQIVLPCRSKPQTDWEMLWEAVTNTPLSAYRLPGLGGTPKPKSLPLTFHYVQARESLWDIGGQYGASPFSIMDLNGLTGPDIFPASR
jgi:LysM repeat protein